MSKFTITIETDNAAFEEHPLIEVSRILHEQADKLKYNWDCPTWSDSLRDINGNKVGKAELHVDN